MPMSQHHTPGRRSSKSSRQPAKTNKIATKNALAASIPPPRPTNCLTQISGNERK